MAEQTKRTFELRKVYVKDLSFESPMAPKIFRAGSTMPAVDVQINVGHDALGDDMYESVLIVTVNGKVNEKDAFLAEVHQAGVYHIAGVDADMGLTTALEVACPNMLFPFAREAINDLVVRGGFPPLLLSPVNFETLYRHKAAHDQEDDGRDAETAAAPVDKAEADTGGTAS